MLLRFLLKISEVVNKFCLIKNAYRTISYSECMEKKFYQTISIYENCMIGNFLKCWIEISKVKKIQISRNYFFSIVSCNTSLRKKKLHAKIFFVYNVDQAELSYPKKQFFFDFFSQNTNSLLKQTFSVHNLSFCVHNVVLDTQKKNFFSISPYNFFWKILKTPMHFVWHVKVSLISFWFLKNQFLKTIIFKNVCQSVKIWYFQFIICVK